MAWVSNYIVQETMGAFLSMTQFNVNQVNDNGPDVSHWHNNWNDNRNVGVTQSVVKWNVPQQKFRLKVI